MKIPQSDDVRWHSIMRATQQDEAPDFDPPLSQSLILIVAFAIVTFVVVGWAVLG